MANTAVKRNNTPNIIVQEPQYDPNQSQYNNNNDDLIKIIQKLEELKAQKATQNIQTSQQINNEENRLNRSVYDTGRLDYQHYERFNRAYKALKLGIDPSMLASKIHPGLSLPVGMLWSQGLLWPAKYGYMDKSFVFKGLQHIAPGLSPDLLTGLVLSHYMLQKSPDVLKGIYERNKARLTYGNTLPIAEHAYQGYRMFNDFTKLFYAPMISLMSAGLIGKGLQLSSPFISAGISHLPLALKAIFAPTLLPLQLMTSMSGIFNAIDLPKLLLDTGAFAGKYLNPFRTVFPFLGQITGLNALANFAASGLGHIPLIGSTLANLITTPGVPFALGYAALGIGITLARSFAMRKYRTKDVNAYELEQKTSASYQLQPLLMQLITRDKKIDPMSVLQLETLMLIEQHTSIIPLLYNLLHHSSEVKRAGSEEGRDIIYGKQIEPEDIYWFEKPQKFLEKLRIKYDPFAQFISFLMTGKKPKDFIKEVLYREETRNKERQQLSKELGVSYTTTSLLGTNALYLISQAKSYESKVIALLSGIYDLNRSQLSELIAIRKYGFGIKDTIQVELHEPFQKSLTNIIGDAIKGLVKYNFNVYKGIYKYLRGQREESKEIFKDIGRSIKETITEAPFFNAIYNSTKLLTSIPKLFKKETYSNLKEKVKQKFSKQEQIEETQLSINEQQLELDKRQINYLESMDTTLQGIYLILRDIYKTFISFLPKGIRKEKEQTIDTIDKFLYAKRRAIVERELPKQEEQIESKYQQKYPDYIDMIFISPTKKAFSFISDKYSKLKKAVTDKEIELYFKGLNLASKPIGTIENKTIEAYFKGLHQLNKPIYSLEKKISPLTEKVTKITNKVDKYLNKESIKTTASDIFNLVKDTIKEIKHIPKFAEGGEVPGKDTGKDKIVSVLRPGEFVLSHDHLKELGKKYIKEVVSKVKSKSESLLQRQQEVSVYHKELFEKQYKNKLLEYVGGIYHLLKKGLSFGKEQKKEEENFDLFGALGGVFGAGLVFGKKLLGKLSAKISEKIIQPIFTFFMEKVIPASVKDFASKVSGKIGSSFVGKLLGKILTKGAAKVGLRALPFGIGAAIAEGVTGGSVVDIIGAGIGGAIGGALGLVGGPIGEFFGSIIGSEIGKWLFNKLWGFIKSAGDIVKDLKDKAFEGIKSLLGIDESEFSIKKLLFGSDNPTTIDIISSITGGLLGSAFGPIGALFGAKLGRFIIPKMFNFIKSIPDYIKNKAKDISDWFEKEFKDSSFGKIINFILKSFEFVLSLPIKLFKTIKSGINKLFKGFVWLLKKIPGVGAILDKLGIGTEDKQEEPKQTADTSVTQKAVSYVKAGLHTAKEAVSSIFGWVKSKITGSDNKPEQKAVDVISGSDKLAQAQLEVESGLNPYAVSPKGAKGIAQFMPKTWNYIWTHKDKFAKYNPELKNFEGIPDIYDVKAQKAAYKAYMNYLKDKFGGSIQWALAAYNWGETNVKKLYEKYHGNFSLAFAHLPRETQRYVEKILGKVQYAARKIESTDFQNKLKQYAKETKKKVYETYKSLTEPEQPTTKEQTTNKEEQPTTITTADTGTQPTPQTPITAHIKEVIDTKTMLFINKIFDNSLFAFEEYMYKNVFDQYN